MEFIAETAQIAIAHAYDNLKREEFLNRIYAYIGETIETTRLQERLSHSAVESFERLLTAPKTKPGPKAKTEQTAMQLES